MTKLKSTVDEDGWTRVSKKDRKGASLISNPVIHQAAPPAPELGYTLDQLRKGFEEIERKWLISDSSRRLMAILEQEISPTETTVYSSVLFGTGSFCGLVNNWIGRHDVALLQLAVFKTAVDFIGLSNVDASVSMS